MVAAMVKLIVWDLDETLWQGTLAEGDSIRPFVNRMEAIKTLNRQGVVNAICSKNDESAALEKLAELGMGDEFVFNEIAFEPKGVRVRRIVEDMNLRFPDVVFVDDNVSNLKEVEFACEGIITIDATTPVLDQFLSESIQETVGGSSRVERYRILERKRADKESSGVSNTEFLRSSGVKVSFLRMADNLPFSGRIEELINRTNQLNFLKTRVRDGEISESLISTETYEASVFVWDDYGSYGLVGFASIRANQGLEHFTFSCRTMNMGIENALAWQMKSFKQSRGVEFPVDPVLPDWITVMDPDEPEAKRVISALTDTRGGDPAVRIMANCQSAALAHYLGDGRKIDFDNWPRTFTLGAFAGGDFLGEWRPTMVYAAFVDYLPAYWPRGIDPSLEEYSAAVSKFVAAAKEQDSNLIVILPVEDFVESSTGASQSAYKSRNEIWRDLAGSEENIQIIELSSLTDAAGTQDPRHFSRDQLRELAVMIRDELDRF
ncbi:hypothetical protein HMPREF3104_02780 [Corynebacterium sp. HMSC30G07]|nr:hypothetical protein HMPREF3104_02780 [Corynebacterium sp. HMSC30G07]